MGAQRGVDANPVTNTGNRFSDWLATARATDNAAGDLVADARSDSKLPTDFDDLQAFKSYLRIRGACNEAVEAASDVWRRYGAWKKRRLQPPGDQQPPRRK